MLSPLKVWALLLALLAAAPASAIYRCGNVFQDRPCTNGAAQVRLGPSGQALPSAGSATPATATAGASPFAVACTRLGQDAQRVAWKREAGATQEKQIAELPANGAREDMIAVITSVYSRRGSAPEIRAAVEAECVAEKKKQSDAAAALKGLSDQAGKKSDPAATPSAAPAAEAAAKAQASAASDKPDPRAACPGLRSQEESLKGQMRAGGSAATMERYNTQRRQLDKQLLDAKC